MLFVVIAPPTTGIYTYRHSLSLHDALPIVGYTGLALALSVTTSSEAVILILFLRGRIGHVVENTFGPWLLKVGIAAAGLAAVILLTEPWLEDEIGRAHI